MLKKLLGVLVIVIALFGFLLVRDWDSPELGKTLLDKVGEATGVEMSAEGFRLNLFRGLVLEKVEAKSSSSGRDVHFSLDRLVFEHRLGPLLSGTVAIESVVLERPQIELVESGDSASGSKETSPVEAPITDCGGAQAIDGRRRRIGVGH